MVVNRQKKITKQRGSQRYGHGRIKRKAGSRGGKGHAGIGKRGKSKKPKFSQSGRTMGKFGFTKHNAKTDTIINLKDLDVKLNTWVDKNEIKKEGDSYVLDLGKLGYTKLLSTGKVTKKLNITVAKATKKTQEKVTQAGGQVTLPKE